MDDLPKGLPMHGLKAMLESTYNYHVKSRVGDYAGVFHAEGGYELVSSTDGVGTKVRIACEEDSLVWPTMDWPHEVIGQDIVNHCVNDILVLGAEPLFFLNCFSYSEPKALGYMHGVFQGMVKAARNVFMPIISGETARMEGFYPDGNYDIVGTIIGQVYPNWRIKGDKVAKGDRLIAIPSTGPHTNGYTTIRRVFTGPDAKEGAKKLWSDSDYVEGSDLNLGMPAREAVMQPHRCYYWLVMPMIKKLMKINAIAHITGGGIEANLKRVIAGHKYELRWGNWEWPRLFRMIKRCGDIPTAKMQEEFNLGIGLVLVVPEDKAQETYWYLRTVGEHPHVIGEITG